MEGGSDSAGVFLAVLSALDPKVFSSYIVSVLQLGIGVGFLFGGIIKKIELVILLKGLGRD